MKERRTILQDTPSIRIESKDGKEYFTGYAAVYNKRSRLIYEFGDLFYEVMEAGAFDRVLEDPLLDVILRIDHNRGTTLARTKSKTLELRSDDKGLFFRTEVPNTTLGRDTAEMIRRGDYLDCSFEFTVSSEGEKWERDGDGNLIHRVREVSGLYDVTICTENGAYPDTVIDTEKASRMAKEIPSSRNDDGGDDNNNDDGNGNGDDNSDDGNDGADDGGDNSDDNSDDVSKKEEEERKAKEDLDQMSIDLLAEGADIDPGSDS